MFDTNQRQSPRASYPCQLTLWMANGPNETILANTFNIGVGGLSVYLNRDVNMGTKADIVLHFTNTSTPFRCRGVVVHSNLENKKFYNVGIQFEPLSETKYAFLDGKISEIIAFEQKGKD